MFADLTGTPVNTVPDKHEHFFQWLNSSSVKSNHLPIKLLCIFIFYLRWHDFIFGIHLLLFVALRV